MSIETVTTGCPCLIISYKGFPINDWCVEVRDEGLKDLRASCGSLDNALKEGSEIFKKYVVEKFNKV